MLPVPPTTMDTMDTLPTDTMDTPTFWENDLLKLNLRLKLTPLLCTMVCHHMVTHTILDTMDILGEFLS